MNALDLSFELAQIRGAKLEELRELETRAERHLDEVRGEAVAADATLKQIRRIISALDPPLTQTTSKNGSGKKARLSNETLDELYDVMLTDPEREWTVADLATVAGLSNGGVRTGIRQLRDDGRVRLTGQTAGPHAKHLYRAIPTLPERSQLPVVSHVS